MAQQTTFTPAAPHSGPGAPPVIDLRDLQTPVDANGVDTHAALVISVQRMRQVRFAAVVMLTVLNVLDLITTRMFLDRGLEEGNAFADVFLQNGTMPYIKAAILLALAWSSLRSAPKLGTTCAMWCVVGIYITIIAVNSLALASL